MNQAMTEPIRMPEPGTPEFLQSTEPGGVFDQWHAACRASCPKDGPETADTGFARDGFEKLVFMDAAAAGKLRRHIDNLAAADGNVTSTGEYQDKVQEPSDDFLYWLLGTVLSPEVERRAHHCFGSEFFVHWYMYTRAYPYPAPDESFLWHHDIGPGAFINIMVYLNGTDAHGGGTEFLDMETTEKVMAAGYARPQVKDREADLSRYADKAGVPYEPARAAVAPGEGFIFQPNRVMHRGILPTNDPRYVMFLNLLPSCRSWRDAFQCWPKFRMEEVAGNWTPDFIPFVAANDGPLVIERAGLTPLLQRQFGARRTK